jgi:7,8-dihydro-6-hydroxymethylpterin dimethyltransferase
MTTQLDRKVRPYLYYDQTTSVCSTCLMRVEAKIYFQDERVWLDKWCPKHGRERVMIADDIAYWRSAREQYLKVGEMPERFQTGMKWGCPYDCGLCPDHQQHACVCVVEITDQCNLRCPVCFADSGPHRPGFKSLAEVTAMLDAVVAAEGNPDVVQLSGGEPTLHPELDAILAAAKARPIRHLMLNTNGIRIATDPGLVERLARLSPGFEVYLQFDSVDDEGSLPLRGARLAELRYAALERLEEAGISTTLVCTLARGVNDHQVGAIIDLALKYRCVRGVTFQPVEQAGRVEAANEGSHRLTLTETRRLILEGSSLFSPQDIIPVPCHPETLAMGYALKIAGQVIPLSGYLGTQELISATPNTIIYERFPQVRELVAKCFSTGIGPEGAAKRLGQLLCCLPAIDTPGLSYENVFRVLIVRFPDAHDFDIRSAKKSCVHFARPDGKIIPFEMYNLFYRDDRRARLEELRAQVERGWSL